MTTHIHTRTPPAAVDAESALLGCIVLDNECLPRVRELVGASDFTETANAAIYKAMLNLADAHQRIDLVTLKDKLRSSDELESIGGVDKLVGLVESVPSPVGAITYARAVAQEARRRELIAAGERMIAEAYAGGDLVTLYERVEASMADAVARGRASLNGAARRRRSSANLLPMEDVQSEAITWLWPGRIALGKLALIAGDPGLGKSFITLDIAARISTGSGWPDAPGVSYPPGGVVLLSAEDDPADTIRPRLDAAGADCTRIAALSSVRRGGDDDCHLDLAADLDAIEGAIDRVADCRLVVIDPVSSYIGRADSHRNSEVRSVLGPLSALAARRRVAILAVTHLSKGGAGGPAIYRSIGSIAFVAAARTAWGVTKDKDDATRRLVLPLKNNLAPDTGGLAYALRGTGLGGQAVVSWEAEPVTVTADDAMGVSGARRRGPEPDARDEAADWLRAALADGPRLAKEMYEEGIEGEGIKQRTIERARKEVGIVAYRLKKNSGPWWWRLPEKAHRQDSGGVPDPPPEPKIPGGLGGLRFSPENSDYAGDSGGIEGHNAQTAKLSGSGGIDADQEEVIL